MGERDPLPSSEELKSLVVRLRAWGDTRRMVRPIGASKDAEMCLYEAASTIEVLQAKVKELEGMLTFMGVPRAEAAERKLAEIESTACEADRRSLARCCIALNRIADLATPTEEPKP